MADAWVWECGSDGRVRFLAPEFERSTDLSLQSLLGRSLSEVAATNADAATQRVAIAAGEPFCDLVFKIERAIGHDVWLSFAGAPIIDPDGSFAGYRGVGKTVTDKDSALAEKDRLLAETEQRYRTLCESEQRSRQLVDLASDWFWEIDAAGRFTYVSANVEAVLGLPASAYLGKRLVETEGVSVEPAAGRMTLEAFQALRPYRDFIYRRRLANGKVVCVSSSGAPHYGADGAFLGYRGVARDVTAQFEAEQRLRDLEWRYRRLFEMGTDSYWETDTQGRVTYVSSAFETSTGIPASELLGQRLNELPAVTVDRETGRKSVAAMKALLPYTSMLHTIARADGRVIHVGTDGMPMFDESGQFTGYCGVSKDITVQVEAERALRDSERQTKELLEAAADYYWEYDTEHRYVYISPQIETLTGVSAASMLGKRLTEVSGVSVDPAMGTMARLAIKAKQPFRDFVYSRKCADRKIRWFKTGATPRFSGDGSFLGYRGLGAEITAHIEADQAARLAQRRLQDAAAHLTQPFVFYDAEDRATAYNQTFTDLHREPGGTMPVAQGVSFRDLAEWQLRVNFYAQGPDAETVTLDLLFTRYRGESEHTYHLSDGRWMMVVYRPLPGGGRIGLWTDITAVKRAEAKKRQLEAQLHHAQRLEALGTLAGGAAHEINNALVPVIALTKMVAAKLPEGSRERRNLGTVISGAERSRDLVRQILDFSRKEDEQRARESIDVGAVLRDALRMMRATVPTSIDLAADVAPAPPVPCDPNQLQQVIVNLVTNAAQAIGEGHGRISVGLRAEPDGAALRLWVADTGCGMDEATKARIFEPFFTTKEAGKGTGLGLSVVHGIITAHGGRIDVQSAPGRGTRFDIVLPTAAVEAVVVA